MAKPGRKKKRRTRTQHPGVKILLRKRAGVEEIYVARWKDPDTGRSAQVSLTALDKTTAEARRDWCIDKSNTLRARKAAIVSGVPLRSETGVAKALKRYYESAAAEGLKPRTLVAYKQGTGPFEAWCHKIGVRAIESLSPAKLAVFRKWFVALPAFQPVTGEKVGRGKWAPGKRRRSPAQVNKGLNSLRVVLNKLRREGLTPDLSSDSIRDSLAYVKRERALPRFLRAKQIETLLKAAQRHDAEGRTPIAEFVAAALLTGFRFTELAELTWAEVDLDAGEIRLDAARVKTGHGRVVPLDKTPALAAILVKARLRAGGNLFVFGATVKLDGGKVRHDPMRRDRAEAARKRLVNEYGAPAFSWHDLRRTCGTFLTCAPGIYGAASAFLSAKRLGHSVAIAEKFYAGALTNIPAKARTLEAAMSIKDMLPTHREPAEGIA